VFCTIGALSWLKEVARLMRLFSTSVILASIFLLAACEREQATLRFATPFLPVDREIAEDLASILGESGDVSLQLSTPELSEGESLDSLLNGDADIALVSNAVAFRRGIATVIPMYPTVLHVAYHEGRDASSGEELLTGARVFAGPEGSASRQMFESIARHLRLSADDYEYVKDLDAESDVLVLFTPVAPARVAQYPDMRLFSFGTPADIGAGSVIDAATLLNPHLRPFVIPEGTYGLATPQPVVTLAVDKVLVAREDLDASVVYDLVLALLRSRPALAARHPGLFEQLAADFDVTRSTFVVHPGAQAYLQREAPTIYERYSGVAEVAVTVLVALASATVAGMRIYQRRRKNRIDRFYSSAIEIRGSVGPDSPEEARQEAIASIRELQNSAFDQLVDEKLAADESFRVFITLSNDVLRQLGAFTDQQRISDD
jgi:TRAP-type uncharacterized transport system substrate-binding protein